MKKVVRKLRIQDEKSDFLYWQSQPPQKRIEALEKIRTEYISWKYDTQPRFQRVYRIIKL
ncbi:hypothetical protein PN36_14215 [Candidatus Thiomargarita nelsonii]|uniref:Toxin secretion, membrane fusion protein n=1 Tax=Candidatus Thiomargarita nelsonii TaxID=1003181 RepID=A0A4E0QPU8_9GAMM|nr:hypothetical protein PN36_14215 [Candidatus Thiomargarita nelsonii]